jgi:hypothetical protein
MRRILILFLSLLFIQCTSEKYSEKDFYSKAALKSERAIFFDKSINQTITESLSHPLNDSTEQKYMSAFWAMELIQYKNEFTDSVINSCFNSLNGRSAEFQRSFLELVYTLYQNKFTYQVEVFAKGTENPKLFAMCLDYLKQSNYHLNKMLEEFLERNPLLIDHPIMIMLKHSLYNASISLPPIEDLFGNRFEEKLVIFSIQRSNRDYPGLLIIRKPDGKFLRDESGKIFSIPQLARAITDLPGYITNGNTPEGILSIQGIDFSKNVFIGPSPNLQLVLPYEVSPQKYFHGEVTDTGWNKDFYSNLLPDSWKNYLPVYEAYYAGKAGRNEIIAHGTTIDPGFYFGSSYFPFTPSLGCLTTKELWSLETGKIVESGQIKLMNALSSIEFEKGYFVVVNIEDTYSPVTLNEIKDLILKAEK